MLIITGTNRNRSKFLIQEARLDENYNVIITNAPTPISEDNLINKILFDNSVHTLKCDLNTIVRNASGVPMNTLFTCDVTQVQIANSEQLKTSPNKIIIDNIGNLPIVIQG